METNQANEFARHWLDAFNAHNLDEIIEHYADDIEFHSPFIKALKFNDKGMVQGREALRQYLQKGLDAYPELAFKLHEIFIGVESLVVYYTSVNGLLAAESFWLNEEGRAVKVVCHYSSPVPGT